MRRFHLTVILAAVLGIVNLAVATSSAQEINGHPDSYKVILNQGNSLYRMNPDGSERIKLLDRPDILDFIPLSDGRIFIHSKQYDGYALEIFDPERRVWALVEFSEGIFPNIAVSEDGSIVAYEIRHMPISTEGDGIWLFVANKNKTHLKISGSALSIESIGLFNSKLYILYHELDLISDESGLFIESFPLSNPAKSRKTRIPEGMKVLLSGGYSLGFTYPSTGKKLEIKHVETGADWSVDAPSGDITLNRNCFKSTDSQMLIFENNPFNPDSEDDTHLYVWYLRNSKIEKLDLENIADISDFAWSPDDFLYFNASYIDLSGAKTNQMLFRMDITSGNIELVSVNGGNVAFTLK